MSGLRTRKCPWPAFEIFPSFCVHSQFFLATARPTYMALMQVDSVCVCACTRRLSGASKMTLMKTCKRRRRKRRRKRTRRRASIARSSLAAASAPSRDLCEDSTADAKQGADLERSSGHGVHERGAGALRLRRRRLNCSLELLAPDRSCYGRLQKVATWMGHDLYWLSFFLLFWVGGPSCSNFVSSTVVVTGKKPALLWSPGWPLQVTCDAAFNSAEDAARTTSGLRQRTSRCWTSLSSEPCLEVLFFIVSFVGAVFFPSVSGRRIFQDSTEVSSFRAKLRSLT